MNSRQLAHFANVRDVLHIYGYDVHRADFDVLDGKPPTFRLDQRTFKSYAAFMRAANALVWTLL